MEKVLIQATTEEVRMDAITAQEVEAKQEIEHKVEVTTPEVLRSVKDFPPNLKGASFVDELKFERPSIWTYVLDLVSSVASLVSTMGVMMLATYPLVDISSSLGQLSIYFPWFIITFLQFNQYEITLRKYFYYRLLDYGLAMDWKDRDWKRSYWLIYIFILMVLLIVATLDWKTGLVIAFQTFFLVLFVMKLYGAETELVTFNRLVQSDYYHNLQVLTQHVKFVEERVVRDDIRFILDQRYLLSKDVKAGKITQQEIDENWFLDFSCLGRLHYKVEHQSRLTDFFWNTCWGFLASMEGAFAEKQDKTLLSRLNKFALFVISYCGLAVLLYVGIKSKK
eukprot:TRINITY_DN9494_c0_g1_i2.p1 TRINITY_DN9494_c0_g1~~TRINITY_DN9494_c0_g1_i2.p1  ORF type:complete len:337 (-),score=29.31 TRINITY_DN9494_c0_g1_i2:105-1115(-)